jgi:hypothetical protein
VRGIKEVIDGLEFSVSVAPTTRAVIEVEPLDQCTENSLQSEKTV